jgi:hypothetical protein
MKLPADTDLDARIELLEHYSKTILMLSALNGLMNIATIAAGFFIATY